ncbi:hypothetical protein BC826DRAFT_967739 [Russula brevipes]|nr:hypothetical protein BC826DRAFT_967739 [Russula brevipes]
MSYFRHSCPQNAFSDPDTKTISHSVLADNAEHIVSYDGTGQHNNNGAGAAACGLAALNFAKTVFSIEQGGLKDIALLQAVLARGCIEESTARCASWPSNLNLEVEDISHAPLFEQSLELRTTTYGLPGVSEFTSLLTELSNLESSAVAIITCSPQILACLKLRLTTKDVFLIFDSHPRPSHPNGAGVIISPSIEGTAHRLTKLLSTVDLRSQTEFRKSERERSESEIKGAEARTQVQEKLMQRIELTTNPCPSTPQRHFSKSTHHSSNPSSSEASTSTFNPLSLTSFSTSSRLLRACNSPGGPPIPPFDRNDDVLYAMHLQREYDDEDRALFVQRADRADNISYAMRLQHEYDVEDRTLRDTSCAMRLQREYDEEDRALRDISYAKRLQREYDDEDRELHDSLSALRLQREYDDEDHALAAQLTELANSAQPVFQCGVCMEEMPEDSIARLDPCAHPFCRQCLLGHVTARLGERRFPMLCPTCTASKGKGKEAAGQVSQSLALNLGITEEQNTIWIEMEMAEFSIHLQCRKCQRMMFVARDEYEEVSAIVCPLPDCNYVWCKHCQQRIDLDSKGPQHSCDGTSELDHLIKQQGWKYCPSEPALTWTRGCIRSQFFFSSFDSVQDADPERIWMSSHEVQGWARRWTYIDISSLVVHNSRMQHALLLYLWWSHREISQRERDQHGGNETLQQELCAFRVTSGSHGSPSHWDGRIPKYIPLPVAKTLYLATAEEYDSYP